jgi:hypothetical protein
VSTPTQQREKMEEILQQLSSGARSFADKARAHASVDVRDLIDPEGEAIASIVDGESSAGAAMLAAPLDLLTFDTWVLGHVGDRDELDLDVGSHRDLWFTFGAWIGEAMKHRHGGFWLFGGDDPKQWRIGFTKIMLEIAPHVFAEKLLRSGPGMARRMISEIERIRQQHEAQSEVDGKGVPKDKFGPQHYARMHTVPLAQWLVLDMGRLKTLWTEGPTKTLRTSLAEDAKRLPPQNAPILQKVDEALAKVDQDKPAAPQVTDRGLYEAIAQIAALRRATPPIAVDLLEKVILPAAHMGIPDKFPPLGDDDLDNIKKGMDLFAVMVDVCPFQHAAPENEGDEPAFLGTFTVGDMSTPYPDRQNLELGKGDWLMVNPGRLWTILKDFDGKKLVDRFDAFVTYAAKQPGVPRLPDANRNLAETAAKVLMDLKATVGAVHKNHALVFRLLPPPG